MSKHIDRADVDTKSLTGETFGNDAIGFIRVRKRKLKGGQPSIRSRPSVSAHVRR
jgi:hypothetical protein